MISLLLSVLLGGFVTHNVLAKKKHIEEWKTETIITFQSGVSRIRDQHFSDAIRSFQHIENLLLEMQSMVSPLLLSSHSTPLSGYVQEILTHTQHLLALFPRILHTGEQFSDVLPALLRGSTKEFFQELTNGKGVSDDVFSSVDVVTLATQNIIESPLSPDILRNTLHPFLEDLHELQILKRRIQGFFSASSLLHVSSDAPHRVAIFFQNSGEIRATGGFPGSLAILSLDNASVTAKFYDIYTLSWKYHSNIPSPPGFNRIAKNLTLQDANFSPDFPTSAMRMQGILSQTGILPVQTILVVNDTLLQEVLRYTGDIFVPFGEKKILLSAQNISQILSFFVEAKASGKHTPKDILPHIFHQILPSLEKLSPKEVFEIVQTIQKHKWALLFSEVPEIQSFSEEMGFSGEIQSPDTEDYLAVFSANVGGNKSDHFLKEHLFLTSVGDDTGDITNTLRIQHRHTWGQKQEEYFRFLLEKWGSFHIDSTVLWNILGAGENHSWVQVFVPSGSILTGVKNIPQEYIHTTYAHGKTVFSFRFPKVFAGHMQEVELQYRLPKKVFFGEDFSLFLQTQSGRKYLTASREVRFASKLSNAPAVVRENIVSDTIFP